ncbi:MAG: FAD-binding oxidoreductase [Cyanobacteria bacterium P01_H01_bin.58]
MAAAIAQTLRSILSDAQLMDWEHLSEPFKLKMRSAIASKSLPVCIAYPETPEQLAEVVTCAHQNQWCVLPCGQGSKLSWGGLLAGIDLIVSTQRLHRLIEHAVGDLTVTVQAGMSFADLQGTLLNERQFLPIDPAYASQATLGGIVATRDTGALRQRYGGIRDLLIGISFIRHDGQQAKAGGRVVKNVAGYDLMKLMTGSFGTLGIVTDLTFRLYPVQAASQTVILRGEAENIQSVVAEVRQSSLTPVAMDILSPGLLDGVDPSIYGLAIQFQSIEAGVAEQVALLLQIASPNNVTSEALQGDDDRLFWQTLNHKIFPAEQDAKIAIAKLGILPTKTVSLLTTLDATLSPGSWQARIHASSGIGTVSLNSEANTIDRLVSVRSYCEGANGYLTLLEAPPAWKTQMDPWALTQSTQMLMAQLQNQFDPQKRLSPGRL